MGMRPPDDLALNIHRAKAALWSLPPPWAWRHRADVRTVMERAFTCLQTIPPDDPEYAACAAHVERLKADFVQVMERLDQLSGPATRPRTHAEILALEDVALVLATVPQKLGLIGHLLEGIPEAADQEKILEIVADAALEGQLAILMAAAAARPTITRLGLASSCLHDMLGNLGPERLGRLRHMCGELEQPGLFEAIDEALRAADMFEAG